MFTELGQHFLLHKQPVDAWKARINGTDLQALVNDTFGKAFITIDNADGTESHEVGWDEGHPLSVLVKLNGAEARVLVSITNSKNTYTGCYGTYNLKHRP